MAGDLTTQLLSMQTGRIQQSAQIAIMRKNHQMDMALVDMIDDTLRNAPAPTGQGRVVDKRA